MERLLVLVNRELVNSKRDGSIAEYLIFEPSSNYNHDTIGDDNQLSKRLRTIFPTFFYDEQYLQQQGEITTSVDRPFGRDPLVHSTKKNTEKKDTVTEGSESTDENSSLYSDLSDATGRYYRPSLKLPALRIFVSSLELLSNTKNSSDCPLDLSDWFSKSMLAYLTESLEVINIERVETALCVKAIRLLRSIDPNAMDMLVRDSVLPFVTNIKDYGRSCGDKMLLRECDRLIKIMA
jgi:hypothetical protein